MTAGIYWTFLEAQHECKMVNKTVHVYLQMDTSIAMDENKSFQLPITFHMKHGVVLLDTIDKRLSPVNQIFLCDSKKKGLIVTLYNRSNQILDKEAGDLLCILRHIA